MSEIILFIGLCLFIISFVLFCVCILINCISDRLSLILGRASITSIFISFMLIVSCVIYESLKNLL